MVPRRSTQPNLDDRSQHFRLHESSELVRPRSLHLDGLLAAVGSPWVVDRWQTVHMVTGRLVPTDVGGVQLWVETRPQVAGSEQTAGRVEDAGRRVVKAFDQVQDAIVEVAARVAASVAAMGKRSVDPETMQVEFGLSFTVKGDLVLVGSSAAASLKVILTYAREGTPAAPPVTPSAESSPTSEV